MRKIFLFLISMALLLLAFGCGAAEETPVEGIHDSDGEVSYHFTAEVVKYGNDALYVKVTDAGNSTLSIGEELYVGVANGYDNYPFGCAVEVVYSSESIVDDYGIGHTISVSNVK